MHKKSTAFDKKNTRDFGADIVRITALFMVLWLHFYLRNGFYYTEITDLSGFIAVMFADSHVLCTAFHDTDRVSEVQQEMGSPLLSLAFSNTRQLPADFIDPSAV